MEFIIQHLDTIVVILVFIGGGAASVIRFMGYKKDQQYESIHGWLLQAVLLAEREFGSGTGKLKLSTVYAEFCKQLPWLAKVISFKTFSGYVDKALDEMKALLEKNAAIASVVESKGEN